MLSLQQSKACLDAEQQKTVDGASYEATDSQLQTYLSTPCLAMLGLGPHGAHFSFASWSPDRCSKADGGEGNMLFPVLLAVPVSVSAMAFHIKFPALPTLLESALSLSLQRPHWAVPPPQRSELELLVGGASSNLYSNNPISCPAPQC